MKVFIQNKVISTLLGIALVMAPAKSMAGGKLDLNQVWSRLADLNGELGSVESAEFSPDSKFVVTGTKFDNTVRVFRTSDGTQMWEYTVPQEIERVAWTRDGAYVASVSEDGFLRVFDSQTAEIIFKFEHENGIDGLTVSHDGRYLVTGRERVDGKGVSRVFDTTTWELLHELPHPGTVNELDFTPDDKYLAAIGDGGVRIWKVSNWRVHKSIDIEMLDLGTGTDLKFINTRFSPDGKILAVGATNGFVFFYDVKSGETIRRMNKSGQKLETVEWTKDGRYFLTAGHGYTIDFFAVEHILDDEIENDSIPFALRASVSDALEYMDFNATGTLLTTAHQDGTVQVWTFMSDDPLVNERRHKEVRALQDKLAAEAGKKTN